MTGEEHDMTHAHDWEAPEPMRRARATRQADPQGGWEVAKRVVAAGSAHGVEPRSLLHLQRAAGNGGVGSLVAQRRADEEEQHSPVLDVVGKGGGSPLPSAVRSEMEAGLGADFGSVRIHDGAAAAASAQAVQAKAYTVGDEVVFNRGAYQPDSDAGRHTLAHELTHVVQQRSGPVDGTPTGDGVSVSDPGDRFEQEAEATATQVSAGTSAAPVPREADDDAGVPTASLQREGEGEMEEDEALEGVQATSLQREGDEEPEEEPAG